MPGSGALFLTIRAWEFKSPHLHRVKWLSMLDRRILKGILEALSRRGLEPK